MLTFFLSLSLHASTNTPDVGVSAALKLFDQVTACEVPLTLADPALRQVGSIDAFTRYISRTPGAQILVSPDDGSRVIAVIPRLDSASSEAGLRYAIMYSIKAKWLNRDEDIAARSWVAAMIADALSVSGEPWRWGGPYSIYSIDAFDFRHNLENVIVLGGFWASALRMTRDKHASIALRLLSWDETRSARMLR